MADDVQLTDLEVIQRYSLAVRAATAPREELMASLQADLDWLRDGRRAPAAKTAPAAAPAKGAPAAGPTKPAPTKAARVARAAKAPVTRSPRA